MSGCTTTTMTGASGNGGTLTLPGSTAAYDRLIVVDWVSFTSGAGAADETWTLHISDGVTDLVTTKQTVQALTNDTIFLQFPSGVPGYVLTTGVSTPIPSTGVTVRVNGQGADGGGLTVGYHYESVTMRPASH